MKKINRILFLNSSSDKNMKILVAIIYSTIGNKSSFHEVNQDNLKYVVSKTTNATKLVNQELLISAISIEISHYTPKLENIREENSLKP